MEGLWFIDGIDLYLNFGIVIETGSADFLKPPPKKESIEHDWRDSNGREVDLERFFFDQREGALNMALIGTSEEDFREKLDNFIGHLTKPGLRRFSLKAHGDRSYYIYYKQTSNFTALKPLRGSDLDGKVVYKFSILVVEPEPQLNPADTFLVDEEGRFIIT
ncbi:MAG: hypothetical protein ACK40M_04365 [Flavobacteriales bacterium]